MKKQLFKICLLSLVSLCLFAGLGYGQTITNVTYSNAAAAIPTNNTFCQGEQLRVVFTPSGFPVGTNYSVEVSDAAGVFTVPLVSSPTSSNQTVLQLPTNAPAGAGYLVRVRASTASGFNATPFSIAVTPPVPTIPKTSYDYCQGATNITQPSATATGTNTLRWYASQNAVAYTSTPASFSTQSVTTISYLVSQANSSGCESPKTEIKINILASPTSNPTTNLNVTRCVGDATPLTATPTAGNTVKWYTTSTGGTALTTTTPIPTVSTPGTTTPFYVTQANAAGCEFLSRDAVNVKVVALPTSGPTVSTPTYNYCLLATATPLAAVATTGNTIKWYDALTGGTAYTGIPTPSTATAGTTLYYATQANSDGCEFAARATVTVNVASVAKPTVATAPITYCQGQTPAALSATGLANHTVKWWATSAGGTSTATPPTVSTSAVGSTIYYVSQANAGGCESERASITVNVVSGPTVPPTTNPQVSICVGQQNVPALTATPTSSSYNLIWYNAAGTPQVTAPTPSNGPIGTTTYQVSQTVTGSSCESPKATVIVSVLAAPTVGPTLITPTLNVCLGQPAIPFGTANATPTAGYTLAWYSAASGGTETPAPLAATAGGPISYWVTQKVGNCEFATRQEVKVTVVSATAPTTSPTAASAGPYCLGQLAPALSATAGTTGNSIRWYDALTGGNYLGAAPIPTTSAAGQKTYYFTEANSAGCENLNRKSIAVTTQTGPTNGPAVTSPLTICQFSTPNSLTATADAGNSPVWYGTSATGGTGSGTAPQPSATTVGPVTYYVAQKNSTGCESANRSSIVVNVIAGPATKPTTNTTISTCQNTTAPLLTASPTAGSGNTILWFPTSSGGTGVATAPIINTNVTATTNTTFYVAQVNTTTGCESPREVVSATVYVTAPPTVSATQPIAVCQTQSATLAGSVTTSNSGFDLVWYGTSAAGGTASAAAPTPNTAAVGTTKYYVVQKNLTTNCESSPRTEVSVQVNTLPAAPTVVSPQNFCQTSTALLAVPSGTLRWYSTAAGGTANTSPPTVATSAAGNNTYYVSQVVGSCEGDRATITTNIIGLPVAPTVTNLDICNYSAPATLTAVPLSGNTLRWYNGTALLSAPPTVTPLNYNATTVLTYSVSQVASSGSTSCEGAKVPITATVYATPAPAVATPVTYCSSSTASPLTATAGTGGTLKWYNAGGTSISTPTPSTANVGNTAYYVAQVLYANGAFGGCESPRSQINVVVNPAAWAPQYTTPANYCFSGVVFPLSATADVGWTLNWYDTDIGGTKLPSTPVPNTNATGTRYYWVTQTNTYGCESERKMITMNVNPTPQAPTNVPAYKYCQNAQATAVAATAGSSANAIRWKEADQDSYPFLPTAPTPSTAVATTITYYVSETNSFNCESKRTPQYVTVNPTPAKPDVRTPDIYCQEQVVQALSVSPAAGNTAKWYNGNMQAQTSVPVVSTAAAGTSTYYVSQINGFACESLVSTIQVTVKPLPAPPTAAKTSYSYCQFDANAVPLDATGVAMKWYQPDNSVVNTVPTPPTSSGYNLSWFVTQTVDACESKRTEIKVEVKTTPIPTFTTPLTLCQNQTDVKPLQATGTSVKWYSEKTGGTPQTNAPTPFVQTPGTYFWYVTQVGSNGCESPRGEFVFIIQPLPSATISGSNSIAQGQSATLKIDFLGQGPWTYTLSNGFTSTTTQNPITITVTPLETEVYTLLKISNICGQGIPAGSATVNVKATTITAGTPNISTLCAGTALTVPFLTSDGLPANVQYKLQISKTKDDTDFQSVTTTGGSSPVQATIPTTAKGGLYYFRVIASTPTGDIKGKISDLQLTIRELPSVTVSGPTGQVYDNTDHKIVFSLSGESPWTLVYKDSLANVNRTVVVNISPYEIMSPPKTNTYSVESVTNACGTGTAGSKYRLRVFPLTSVPTSANGEWLKAYPVPVKDNLLIEVLERNGKTVKLELTDLQGRRVLSKKINSDTSELHLSNLAIGTYILEAEHDGKIIRKKILKTE